MNSGHIGVDGADDVDDIDDIDDGDDSGGGDGLDEAGGSDGDGDDGDPDDTIVLPWWQHPFNIAVIVVTAALLAAMVGWMIGDSAADRDAGPVDVGFLQDMREHHEQAVAMSFMYLALDDTQPGLRDVARSIVFGQGIEIGRMIQLLREFGASEVNEGDTAMEWMGHSVPLDEMPGMATDAELDELGDDERRRGRRHVRRSDGPPPRGWDRHGHVRRRQRVRRRGAGNGERDRRQPTRRDHRDRASRRLTPSEPT